MLRVLLIDDEPIIREGLKTIIDWSWHGFEICGEAANGRDGLEKIRRLQPDLIILDIKMPVIDGLEMLERLRQEGDEIQALFLTGYSEFIYAQKAVNLGALGYILKPIDEDDLSAKASKAYQIIMEKKKTLKLNGATISLAADRLIEVLCWGKPDQSLLDRAYELPALQFPWRSYRVCLIGSGGEYDRWYESVSRVLTARPREVGYTFKGLGETVFLLKDEAAKSPQEILDEISQEIGRLFDAPPLITAGVDVIEPKELWLSYWQAQKLFGLKFSKSSGVLIMDSGGESDGFEGVISDADDGLISELRMAMDCHNKNLICDLLAILKKRCLQQNISAEKIKAVYLYLYFMALAGLNLDERGKDDHLGTDQETLNELYDCENLQELHQYIHNKLSDISDYLAQKRPDGIILRITDFVRRNYHQDLKLGTLARLFNYNPAYLGKIFKNHTGEKFGAFLERVRLEEAKRLLIQGVKVGETAWRVGYKDIDYFNSRFKSYHGTVPSAFKKLQDE